MGQFKPMVKMETTEPSVELKLKKGGKVAKKADGGMMGAPMSAAGAMPPSMPARGGMMGAASPMKPSLAARRRAMRGMPAGAGPAGPVGSAAQMQPSMPPTAPAMKKGGKAKGGKAKGGKADMGQDKAMIKKAFKQHDMQEHKGGKGTKLALKKGGKMATGGVAKGQGGYAKGGIINTESQGGSYRNTKMDTAKPNHSSAKTGGVKNGNSGGFKHGGKIKKMATGGVVNGQGGYAAGGSPVPQRLSPPRDARFLPLEQMDFAELERRYPIDARPLSSQRSYRQDNYGNSEEIGYDGKPLSSYSPSKLAKHYAITGTSPSYPTMDEAELEGRYPTPTRQGGVTLKDGTFIAGVANSQGGVNVGTPDFFQKYADNPEIMRKLNEMYNADAIGAIPAPYSEITYPTPKPAPYSEITYPTPIPAPYSEITYPTPIPAPEEIPPPREIPPPPPTSTPQPERPEPPKQNKKGGSIKKAYAAGGTVNSGRPVAMPQGRKPASKPVAINELAGTFKRGGSVTPAQGRLMKANAAENASTMRAAKADNNLKYSKYQKRNGGAC